MRRLITTLTLLYCHFLSTPLTQAETVLTYTEATLLGLVEGITEYLPISSTGHLILLNHALGLDEETPLIAKDGTPLLHQVHGEIKPFTLVEATNTYLIAIQGGAILAVLLLCWKNLVRILLGFVGQDPAGKRLGINLILAFIPAAILGLLLGHWVELHLFNLTAIACALAAGGILILIIEKRLPNHTGRSFLSLKPKEAFLIGCLQCLALWPGTSRSLATMMGGMVVGLSRAESAYFSFLLGFITLIAASSYKLFSTGKVILDAFDLGPFILGFAVTTVTAFIAVKWLIGYLSRHNLKVFAYYRLMLAALIFAVILNKKA